MMFGRSVNSTKFSGDFEQQVAAPLDLLGSPREGETQFAQPIDVHRLESRIPAATLSIENSGLGKALSTFAVSVGVVAVYEGILAIWFWNTVRGNKLANPN